MPETEKSLFSLCKNLFSSVLFQTALDGKHETQFYIQTYQNASVKCQAYDDADDYCRVSFVPVRIGADGPAGN